jgi:hypothetical protein
MTGELPKVGVANVDGDTRIIAGNKLLKAISGDIEKVTRFMEETALRKAGLEFRARRSGASPGFVKMQDRSLKLKLFH